MASRPLSDLAPFQPSLAVQLLAFVLDHVNVTAAPLETTLGVAASDTRAGSPLATVTEVDSLASPAAPVHVMLNCEVLSIGPTLSLPLVLLVPDQSPLASHPDAFVEAHVSTAFPPAVTTAGSAVMETVTREGGGFELDGGAAPSPPPPPPQAQRTLAMANGAAHAGKDKDLIRVVASGTLRLG